MRPPLFNILLGENITSVASLGNWMKKIWSDLVCWQMLPDIFHLIWLPPFPPPRLPFPLYTKPSSMLLAAPLTWAWLMGQSHTRNGFSLPWKHPMASLCWTELTFFSVFPEWLKAIAFSEQQKQNDRAVIVQGNLTAPFLVPRVPRVLQILQRLKKNGDLPLYAKADHLLFYFF